MGCVRAAWINHGDKGVGGIPFFAKRAIYRQTTIYEVKWLEVTLSMKPEVSDPKTATSAELVANAKIGSPELDTLRKTLVETSPGVAKVTQTYDQVIAAFQDLGTAGSSIKTDREPSPADLVSNSLAQVAIVDYTTPYYLNGPLPWFGSTKVNAELNTDGTLSKGAIEADTKLAEGVSALLPLKEFLSGKFVKVAAAGAAAEPIKYQFKLSVVAKGYRYTLTADYSKDPCSVNPDSPCLLKALDKNSTTLWVRAALDAPSGEKKADSDAINFSGSVTLPKADKKEP